MKQRDNKGRFIKGEKIKKLCLNCNKEFEVLPNKKDITQYCSAKCKNSFTKEIITCSQCGKLFEAPKWKNRKVCSKECRGLYVQKMSQVRANHLTGTEEGEKSPNWKGGIFINKCDGNRVTIRKNGKVYPRAQVNWMKANEIYMIPKGFVIHHIDLDKSNDNLENLVLLPDNTHRLLHLALRKEQKKRAEMY